MTVSTGLENLLRSRLELLRGRRVGLISHPAAVLPDLTASLDALRAAGVRLRALFGMEHGFAGSAADGKAVGNAVDSRTGLPVFSLYGTTREPSAEMLAEVDVLLYDVQDVGVRFYTYISTLYYVLKAAGQHGLPVIVLDRPNPINGLAVEGPLVEPGFESFVGVVPIPVRHGMTVGELARYFNAEYDLGADLTVVEMQGWRRSMWFDDTNLPWVTTSPAMPHLSTATVYPGMCLLEGTNVSLGRGTALPFEQLGAPWADAYRLAEALNRAQAEWAASHREASARTRKRPEPAVAVRYRPTSFEPVGNKYAGETCYGVQVHVVDRAALRPVRMGLLIIATLKATFPSHFAWASYPRADGTHQFHFDRLIGSARVREALDAGVSAEEIIAGWTAVEEEFRYRRRAYLLYE